MPESKQPIELGRFRIKTVLETPDDDISIVRLVPVKREKPLAAMSFFKPEDEHPCNFILPDATVKLLKRKTVYVISLIETEP